jgi:hypothetical protein
LTLFSSHLHHFCTLTSESLIGYSKTGKTDLLEELDAGMYTPPYFKALSELLRAGLNDIKVALNNQKSSIDAASHAAEDRRRDIPRAIVGLRPTDDERKAAEANHKQNHSTQRVMAAGTWVTAFATLAAAIGAFVYAHIAAKQAKIMGDTLTEIKNQTPSIQKSADAAATAASVAQKSLSQHDADRRPYVTIKGLGNTAITRTQVIEQNMELLNWGQSLAVNALLNGHIFYGKGTAKFVDDYFRKLPTTPEKPGGMSVIPHIAGQNEMDSPSFSYVTIDSRPFAPSDDAIAFINTHVGGLMLAGRIWYKDTLGHPYWTDFCYQSLLTHAVSTCEKHNEIH